MSQQNSTSLFRSTALKMTVGLTALGGGIALTLALFRAHTGAEELATQTTEESSEAVVQEIKAIGQVGRRSVRVMAHWGASGVARLDEPESLAALLVPKLRETPVASALYYVDADGAWFILERTSTGYEVRWKLDGAAELWRLDRDGGIVRRDPDPEPPDMLMRPWYRDATAAKGRPITTDPYLFHGVEDLGVTVALHLKDYQGKGMVVALDRPLHLISAVTAALMPTPNGGVAIVDEKGKLIGWPHFTSRGAPHEIYKDVAAAGLPQLTRAFEIRVHSESRPLRYEVDGAVWWSRSFRLHVDRDTSVWIFAMVPEIDLLGLAKIKRFHVLAGAAITLMVALLLTHLITREFRRRIALELGPMRKLGQYTLSEKIGEGGMGSVFRAGHAMLRRPTAVKVLAPDYATPQGQRQFEREVQTTGELTHPNTVEIYDYGETDDGTFYYAMEYIDGVTLEELVDMGGPVPAARAVNFLVQICGSLSEAHGAGLVHRDVKPGNVMVCKRGGVCDVVKVIDFGLVEKLDEEQGEIEFRGTGTPMHMAPEAIRDQGRATPATDMYGVGAVAYFMLTGRPVFTASNVIEICAQHLREAPVPPSERAEGIPPELDALVLRCLSKVQAERPTAAELLSALGTLEIATEWTATKSAEWWKRFGGEFSKPPRSHGHGVLAIDLAHTGDGRPGH